MFGIWIEEHTHWRNPDVANREWAEKYEFIEPAGCYVPAAPKEKNMKRNLSLWLGLLAFALMPALAQTPRSPAKFTAT